VFFRFTVALCSAFCGWLLIHQGRLGGVPGKFLFAIFVFLFLAMLAWSWISFRRARTRGEAPERAEVLTSFFGAVAATYLLSIAVPYFFQAPLIYMPVPGDFAACADLEKRGFTAVRERYELGANSGYLRYYARFRPENRATVLIFHGAAESACAALRYSDGFGDLPLNFAVAEYPGYKGEGVLAESAYHQSSERVYKAAAALAPGLPIVLLGRSFGSGVATSVAATSAVGGTPGVGGARLLEGIQPAAGLILVSAYTSIPDIATRAMPHFPSKLIKKGHEFPIHLWIADVKAPLLMIAGLNDRLVPANMSTFLAGIYTKASGRLAEVLPLEGLGHNCLSDDPSAPEWVRVREFTAKLLPAPPN
jgi:alpha-beta hydrolase superfamily lysophospholipase